MIRRFFLGVPVAIFGAAISIEAATETSEFDVWHVEGWMDSLDSSAENMWRNPAFPYSRLYRTKEAAIEALEYQKTRPYFHEGRVTGPHKHPKFKENV